MTSTTTSIHARAGRYLAVFGVAISLAFGAIVTSAPDAAAKSDSDLKAGCNKIGGTFGSANSPANDGSHHISWCTYKSGDGHTYKALYQDGTYVGGAKIS